MKVDQEVEKNRSKNRGEKDKDQNHHLKEYLK